MKRFFFISLLSVLIVPSGHAQRVISLEDARMIPELGTAHMDSLYMSSVHVDTTQAAFRGREEEFSKAHNAMLHQVGDSLRAHGVRWKQATPCTYRIFYRPDGSLAYFMYGFRGALSKEEEQQFKRVLEQFCSTYRFPLQNTVPFKQCGKVVFE